jgi:fused signal recognition particle receptor
VSTGWEGAIDLGARAPGARPAGESRREAEEEAGGGSGGRLRRLRERLSASRKALADELTASVLERLDDADWERLEEALILADVGARTTAEIVGRLEGEVEAGVATDPEAVRARLVEMLAEAASVGVPRLDLSAEPAVVMVVGVNGTGKTTTIGKLASILSGELGQKVVVAAADTYRAAAIEQLETWAGRAGAEIVRGAPGGDPGAVVFDSIAAAQSRGADVVIADTAGRLHTHSNLMEELAKVKRVAGKRLEGAPHETLIVVDATTGQNGLRQAEVFAQAVDLTGVVLTKLDGTAKGGIAVAIAGEMQLPVKMIGVGEGIDDLRPFDPREFATALLSA